MAIRYLKQASHTSSSGEDETRAVVAKMLEAIERGGEDTAREYSLQLDKYDGDIVVGPEAIAARSSRPNCPRASGPGRS